MLLFVCLFFRSNGQGLLSGVWQSIDDIPTYRARTRHFNGTRPKCRHGEQGHEALLMSTLDSLNKIASEAGIPLSDLSIAWLLNNNQGIHCVIAGATKPDQLLANSRASNIRLSEDLVTKLNEATEDLKVAMGTNADLWQGVHADGKNDSRIR
eukprot:c8819_g1_i2.p1 GENE.c8819_g1_i2~~c8819_g1_i2.p1  ORF type:complete len:153 (+),score=27.57 c8819_g1_i2:113-571(+)